MTGHGGNIRQLAAQIDSSPDTILDFSANINPLGPPEYIWNVLARAMPDIIHYPDPAAGALVQAIAQAHNDDLQPNNIVVGNGTSELLFAAVRAFKVKRAVLPVPSYIDYQQACVQAGVAVHPVQLRAVDDFGLDCNELAAELHTGDLVIIGQPNNPTGTMVNRQQLLDLAGQHPDVLVMIDEAFAGFVPDYTTLAGCRENIIVLCSLTKLFAVPGLRLGFLTASEENCRKIRRQLAPWSVNSPAQAVGTAMVGDQAFMQSSRGLVLRNRQQLTDALRKISALHVFPASANFLLLRLESDLSATDLATQLLAKYHIAVRVCDNYKGLDNRYFRIAVRDRKENEQLLAALQNILQPDIPRSCTRTIKKPSLMLLGTGSDVGKSVLVAGLCRVLLQDGVRVAPFKAQNMSLNSYVTRDGGEMGRAQVVQAQACRLDPDVRMNPVLLKPSSDVGSQVIVHGKPIGNMKVMDYVRYKKTARQEVCTAYDALAADFDCIILEGAGSPGEVNLKSHDIVNMRMAQYAEAPALLVGDIDRGGVYASFIGHVEVMQPWERELLAGFVVNRFRGDGSLLANAHDFLLERTGKPVAGVVPYLPDLGLPQEDSVSFKAGLFDSRRPDGDHVDIALIDLPHISNFTDVEPLLVEPDVFLRIVRNADELGLPDCIILPGSKNVMADLAYLDSSGLGKAISSSASSGCEVVGICGGFQMLGTTLADPHGLEGEHGSLVECLQLLHLETELAQEKTLTGKEGVHLLSGQPVHGYEIHHGTSRGQGNEVLGFTDGSVCGFANSNGNIWGTYLHGIFDSDLFRRWFINRLRRKKGLGLFTGSPTKYDLEPALDRLADVLRKSIDMSLIYKLLHL